MEYGGEISSHGAGGEEREGKEGFHHGDTGGDQRPITRGRSRKAEKDGRRHSGISAFIYTLLATIAVIAYCWTLEQALRAMSPIEHSLGGAQNHG
jgi:hypothetical protein